MQLVGYNKLIYKF